MSKFTELTQQISKNLGELKQSSPDLMKGFSGLAGAALKPGVLDAKTKELIALAIGIAGRCDACIGFHTQALVRLGMTQEELEELLAVAVMMGGGPSLMYATNAMEAFKEFSAKA